MNGRTARRLIMRGRIVNFWGRRAYATVRIPREALPTLPEYDFSALGKPYCLTGHWTRKDGDGEVVTSFSKLSGSYPCAVEGEEEDDDAPLVHHLTGEDGWYDWWETRTVRLDAAGEVVSREEGPADALDAWVALQEWEEALRCDEASPLRGFADLAASCHCKTDYVALTRTDVYWTFSITWFYPTVRLGAARLLSRAMKMAKRAGVKVRVVKDVPAGSLPL